jgi:hypothetical protein
MEMEGVKLNMTGVRKRTRARAEQDLPPAFVRMFNEECRKALIRRLDATEPQMLDPEQEEEEKATLDAATVPVTIHLNLRFRYLERLLVVARFNNMTLDELAEFELLDIL